MPTAKPIDVEELISVLTRLVTIRDAAREMVAPVPPKAPSPTPAAALMPPTSPLPGIDRRGAGAAGRQPGALVNLLALRAPQGGAVTEASLWRPASSSRRRCCTGCAVAANLGAADVARLTAAAEAVLHDGAADSLAMPAALSRLEQALELVVRTARNLAAPNRKKPASRRRPN
jgi:hypothetical protein